MKSEQLMKDLYMIQSHMEMTHFDCKVPKSHIGIPIPYNDHDVTILQLYIKNYCKFKL